MSVEALACSLNAHGLKAMPSTAQQLADLTVLPWSEFQSSQEVDLECSLVIYRCWRNNLETSGPRQPPFLLLVTLWAGLSGKDELVVLSPLQNVVPESRVALRGSGWCTSLVGAGFPEVGCSSK